MTTKIVGIKYYYIISLIKFDNDYNFLIQAVFKNNLRTSCINNLNPVLSELDVDADDPAFAESDWNVSYYKGKKYFNRIISCLKDKKYLLYFENILDEDRGYSEWSRRTPFRAN